MAEDEADLFWLSSFCHEMSLGGISLGGAVTVAFLLRGFCQLLL